MKKRVGLYTKNVFLYNKIRLLLRNDYELTLLSAKDDHSAYDMVIVDTNTSSVPSPNAITLGHNGILPLPFKHEDLIELVKSKNKSSAELTLGNDGKSAYLCGERIKLTEVEYKLLSVLISSDTEFISRERLLNEVWGGEADEGVVNVYVHYLRRKLEKNGAKIILSSRKEGYSIDKKYRGAEIC